MHPLPEFLAYILLEADQFKIYETERPDQDIENLPDIQPDPDPEKYIQENKENKNESS
jgi:hypothetical protein